MILFTTIITMIPSITVMEASMAVTTTTIHPTSALIIHLTIVRIILLTVFMMKVTQCLTGDGKEPVQCHPDGQGEQLHQPAHQEEIRIFQQDQTAVPQEGVLPTRQSHLIPGEPFPPLLILRPPSMQLTAN